MEALNRGAVRNAQVLGERKMFMGKQLAPLEREGKGGLRPEAAAKLRSAYRTVGLSCSLNVPVRQLRQPTAAASFN